MSISQFAPEARNCGIECSGGTRGHLPANAAAEIRLTVVSEGPNMASAGPRVPVALTTCHPLQLVGFASGMSDMEKLCPRTDDHHGRNAAVTGESVLCPVTSPRGRSTRSIVPSGSRSSFASTLETPSDKHAPQVQQSAPIVSVFCRR